MNTKKEQKRGKKTDQKSIIKHGLIVSDLHALNQSQNVTPTHARPSQNVTPTHARGDMKLKGGAFLIQAKHLFLTHVNLPILTIWDFFKALQQRFFPIRVRKGAKRASKISGFCVGRETHKSGKIHYHSYIRLHKRSKFTRVNCFDITIGHDTYHGNYQRVKALSATLNYCRKGGQYIEHNINTGLASTVVKCDDKFNLLMILDRANRRREWSFWTRVYELNRERERHRRSVQLTKYVVKFDWFDKFQTPETNMGWLKGCDKRPKGLLLTGPSETGKTSFIVKFAGTKPYFIATEPRHFFNYSGESIIALDQFEWRVWERQTAFLKNLVTGIRVSTPSYYGSKILSTPRIVLICTNENPDQWDMPVALKTRFYVYKTREDQTCTWSMAENRWIHVEV